MKKASRNITATQQGRALPVQGVDLDLIVQVGQLVAELARRMGITPTSADGAHLKR